jgi:ubiquinone/menaquinone biosynthesis C-methylase UbiE
MSPGQATQRALQSRNAADVRLLLDSEVQRVRAAYGRRSDERDRLRYTHFAPAFLFHAQERERKTLALLAQNGFADLRDKRILEVGCEKGRFLLDLLRWGARPENLTGIDILSEHIAAARSICPQDVSLFSQNAAALPFEDASFDLVVQGTTFSSILHAETRVSAAREMLRVLRPSGAILWYDFFFDNPRNRDVRGLRKTEILNLFPACIANFRRISLAPPVARFVAPRSRLLFGALSSLRILNTHYLALIHR